MSRKGILFKLEEIFIYLKTKSLCKLNYKLINRIK